MKNKDSRARMQVIFGVLLFALVLMSELYTMINYPKMFIVLAAIAVVDLLCLYIVINGLMTMQEQKSARNEEQYESVFKSEKASYLMLKKYFEEIEDKLNYLEQASKIPTEEIVNAQKGIAKVIINRSHENTEALMNSYDQLMEEFSLFKDRLAYLSDTLSEYKEEMVMAQKSSADTTENMIQLKMQDLTVALKDMEIRMNNAIMQSQKVIAQAPVVAPPIQQTMPIQQEAEVDETPKQEDLQEEPVLSELETEPELEIEEPIESDPILELDPDLHLESEIEPEIIPEEELESISELEPISEPELEPIPEPAEEETPPMPDLSDPNKSLSADEIAALFANMGGDNGPAPEPELEPEPIPEPVSEPELEPIPEPAEEETPPMPDLSDPNKSLSPDEIAALFANMGV